MCTLLILPAFAAHRFGNRRERRGEARKDAEKTKEELEYFLFLRYE